jgi:hypothetical protein
MEHPDSYAMLARVEERQGRLPQAEAAWQSAVAFPAPAEAIAAIHAEVAGFYQRRGKPVQARSAQLKAQQLRAGAER